MDRRKNNGGHSTKSKKAFDRRKRISVSDTDSFNQFFDRMREDMMVFYESAYKGFLDSHIKHGNYYVYGHYVDDKLVYIGKGKGGRIYSWANRADSEHSELIMSGKAELVVLSNNLEEGVALMIESALIEKYKPIYNGRRKEK